MSTSFVRVMKSLFVFFFFGLLLAAVWFASDLVYTHFIAVPAEESAEEKGSTDVLIALNAKLEEILQEHVANAEKERHELQALLRSRELDNTEEEQVRKRLEEMLQQQRELNRELQETRAEETVFAVETVALRDDSSTSEDALIRLRKQNVELHRTVEELRERWNSLIERVSTTVENSTPGDAQRVRRAFQSGEGERYLSEFILSAAEREEQLRSDIEDLINENRRLAEEKEDLQKELEERERRITRLERSLNVQEAELSRRGLEVSELEERYRTEQERVSELRDEIQSLTRKVSDLRSELGERKSALERVSSSREALFLASGLKGVFHRVDGDLRITVNPRRREEVLETGVFDVYPPGETGKIKSRVLVESEDGSIEYKRYPGQPEPAEGDWF